MQVKLLQRSWNTYFDLQSALLGQWTIWSQGELAQYTTGGGQMYAKPRSTIGRWLAVKSVSNKQGHETEQFAP